MLAFRGAGGVRRHSLEWLGKLRPQSFQAICKQKRTSSCPFKLGYSFKNFFMSVR